MKVYKRYLLSIASCITLFLAGCVDDTLVDKSDQPLQPGEGDTQYFVNLRLKTTTGSYTRADDNKDFSDKPVGSGGFQDGSHDEHKIGTKGNFAIFFDDQDRYISCADLYSVNESPECKEEDDDNDDDNDNPESNTDNNTSNTANPESIYTCRFYGYADRKPAKVLIVVNAPDYMHKKMTDFPGWTLEEVMKRVWEEKGRYGESHNTDGERDPDGNLGFRNEEGTKYFTMTNATYLKYKKDSSWGYEVHCAEDLTEANIYSINRDTSMSDEDIAKEVEGKKPVTVYLERMVSKFDLAIENTENNLYKPYSAEELDICIYNEDGTYSYHSYKWGVEILAWGLNGLETQNYLFKNVDENGIYLSEMPHWFDLYGKWNSEYNKRCYWSVDPHYNEINGIYPWQYRFAANKYDYQNSSKYDNFKFYDKENEKNTDDPYSFSLRYYPFIKYYSGIWDYSQNDLDDDYKRNPLQFSYDNNPYNYNIHTKSSNSFYTPENTFIPGLQVDESRATRAYELAGTHILICGRLLWDSDGNNVYEPFEGDKAHLYRNRVGVCYIDEVSMFEDFMNAVNFKLESQKYLYYNYYPWKKEDDTRKAVLGKTYRAEVDGKYSIFYKNTRVNEYRELTFKELRDIRDLPRDKDKETEYLQNPESFREKYKEEEYDRAYKLTIEASSLNSDGKVLPWICYWNSTKDDWEELSLIVFRNDHPDFPRGKFLPKGYEYDEKANPLSGERIVIDPTNTKFNEYIEGRRLKFETNESGSWKKFGDSGITRDDNDLKSVFFEIWGVADHFNHGFTYYAIPIHSLDEYGNPASDPYASLKIQNNEMSDESRFYYYYGVIRNNWYKFKLRSINEIGIPVSVPSDPIVPNYKKKLDQIKVEMEILNWHVEEITVPL